MTREEALDKFCNQFDSNEDIINFIYDDIGDCTKCNYSGFDNGTTIQCKLDGIFHIAPYYCANFERNNK